MYLSIANTGRILIENLVVRRVVGPDDSTDPRDPEDEISGTYFDLEPGEEVCQKIGFFSPSFEYSEPNKIRIKVSFEANGETKQYTKNVLLKR